MSWLATVRGPRRWATMAVCLCIGAAGSLAAAPTASAAEVYPRPASGTFALQGRGFGHGIGMSQYGAKGAAEAGLTWAQIMAFSYPGTSTKNNGNPLMRVQLRGLSAVAVLSETGLRVNLDRTGAPTAWTVLPAQVSRNGSLRTVTAWDVAYYSDATPANAGWWLRFRFSGETGFRNYVKSPAAATTVAFDNPGKIVRRIVGTGSSGYRGELRHVRSSNTASATRTIVDALPTESYLRGVVPNEMPASWHPEAVRAQSVAARTYAEYERLHAPSGRAYDTCDTTACQVFDPVESELPGADAAIAATAGVVVTSGGAAAFTQFSASNGGYSVAGSFPYLNAHADPYDTYSWSKSLSVATLEATWPAIGRLSSLTVAQRDGRGSFGGRTAQIVLTGAGGSVTVSGEGFRSAVGLQSSLWRTTAIRVSAPSFPRDVTGDARADVVAIMPGSGELRTYPGTGAGAFGRPVTAFAGGWSGIPLVFGAGTWDGDGLGDLMSVDSGGQLRWYRGLGAGKFSSGIKLGPGWDVYNLLTPIGDFDGDRGTDLLGRRPDGTLWLVQGNGQGEVLGVRQVGTGWASFTAVFSPGDFTGDGRSDVLGRDAAGNLWLYAGTGTGGFRSAVRVGVGWAGFTFVGSAGDFSGDHRADVIGRDAGGHLWMYRGSGTGGFGTRSQIGIGWNGLTILP
jgi:stage II sporulation protein D